MNTPSSSDRPIDNYVINNPKDTKELVERIRDDGNIFDELTIDWKYWFASHPEHLGETLTAQLVYQTGLPDVIHFLPERLRG